jgi:23S rRNA (guanosine2251-2'-O)-methyltransferase
MSEILIRRNAVLEALRGNRRQIDRLWLQRGLAKKLVAPIVAQARKRGIPIETADKGKLGQMAQNARHQGVLLEVGSYIYSNIDNMLALAIARKEKAFLLLLDLLQGPQNIGALLRTAEGCGVHGVITQQRRAPDITPAVVQHSAGATEHLLIAQVTNLVETIKLLQDADVWIVGMDLSDAAQPWGQTDLNMAIGIVVGHEGSGLRRLVREKCDILLKLPMRGQLESLNAAVAGSVMLYAAWEARGYVGSDRLRCASGEA